VTSIPCRRFTISDAILLVAATAVGLSQVRGILGDLGTFHWGRWKVAQFDYARSLIDVVVPILAVWTIAFLPIRLRRPRPGLRVLVRQPGVTACYAALIPLLILLAWVALIPPFIPVEPDVPLAIVQNSEAMVSAVLGAWLILWLGGLSRPEPGWIDRLGKIIGALWIGQLILFYLTAALTRLL
jgi:hypothetical protein